VKLIHAGVPVLLLVMATGPIPARADTIAPCPAGVTAVQLPDGIAPALQQALHSAVGDIVLPNQQFDAADTGMSGKSRRFIFVWNIGRKWIVATEHGGIGYNDPVFAYDLSGDGKIATLVATRIAFPPSVCSTASALARG
jgi:hypothetical protein